MNLIFLLLIGGITVVAIFLIAFLWSVKGGQFDDDDNAAIRILFEDSSPSKPSN